MIKTLSQNLLLGALVCGAAVNSFAQESDCQNFRIEGTSIVLEGELKGNQAASIAMFKDSVSDTELLRLDFIGSQLCIDSKVDSSVGDQAWSSLIVNEELEEIVVVAFLDGSYEIPLRLDLEYQAELLLVRSAGEDIGLTEMEFLSDNSGVGAEDFFSEEIGFLQVGDTEYDGLFAEVPRYGIAYDHYENQNTSSVSAARTSRGSIGMGVLRDSKVIIDFGAEKIAIVKP